MDYSSSAVDLRTCINTTLLESPNRSSVSSLHEFEFWSSSAVPSCGDNPAELLTADELFVDGVLLPLRLLSLHHSEPAAATTQTEPAEAPQLEPAPAEAPQLLPAPDVAVAEAASDQPPSCSSSSSASLGPAISASISCAPTTASKRWKDIFKVGERKAPPAAAAEEKKRKKSVGSAGPEEQHLNISIWPFARSRSGGNNASGGRRKSATIAGRRVSSAPCSRSNSRGESSKSSSAASMTAGGRRWAGAASPGRGAGGVHVGRMSPVWQIRQPERKDKVSVAGRKGSSDGVGIRVLNLNVNTCIGYRGQGSCRNEDRDGAAGGARTAAAVGGGSGGGGGGGGLFSPLRTLFSKKVVY